VSPLEPNWERRRLRAPREDGDVLAIPLLADMPAVIAKNRQQIAQWNVSVLGKPLAELRRLAREEVLLAATRFTHQLEAPARDSCDPSLALRAGFDAPLVVGGHQPELFHPGVWAKNFLLDHLAKTTGGIGLHLIVDNDEVASTRLAVPVGSREAPRIERIPFDLDAGSTPWEDARLRDPELFRSFAERVTTALSCWPIRPLLSDLWPAAVAHAAREPAPRLADLLTVVRREAERRAGLCNLELPISQLCETQAFAWFVASLLSDPHRTHSTYNAVVAEYRRCNHVRNRQHPVPDLGTRPADSGNDWLELPFWLWQAGDSRRSRFFVRNTATELQLAAGEMLAASLPIPTANTAESTVGQLRALASRGWKLRPRALTTTLFARVFLADAFLHGIGGAKYDEMTDRLIARLFGVAPPSYLTVTATHRLPLGHWNVSPADVAVLQHRLWDFDHNPERCVTPARRTEGVSPLFTSSSEITRGLTPSVRQEFAELLAEKRRLIAEQQTQDTLDRRDPRRAAHTENDQRRRRLRTISQRLAALASETRSALMADLQTAQVQLAANAILQSREFAFGLFTDACVAGLKTAMSSWYASELR
jgi:hypothetical protein